VKAGNTYGWSAYSAWLNFSVSSAGSGFDSQFNGSKTGWYTPTGDPTVWNVNSTYLYTSGAADGNATTIYYNAHFSSLDYAVKLKRIGVDDNNYLMFRGDPTSIDSYHDWRNSYSVGYNTAYRDYSVWKCVSGSCSVLQDWTYTAAIVQGDAWNILRVTASGNMLKLYINGTLVWTGTDTSFTTGHVGIEPWGVGTLQVDYATLTTTVSGVAQSDVISAEQAALNAAANQQRGVNISRKIAPTPK
jgi:hypothetical protein